MAEKNISVGVKVDGKDLESLKKGVDALEKAVQNFAKSIKNVDILKGDNKNSLPGYFERTSTAVDNADKAVKKLSGTINSQLGNAIQAQLSRVNALGTALGQLMLAAGGGGQGALPPRGGNVGPSWAPPPGGNNGPRTVTGRVIGFNSNFPGYGGGPPNQPPGGGGTPNNAYGMGPIPYVGGLGAAVEKNIRESLVSALSKATTLSNFGADLAGAYSGSITRPIENAAKAGSFNRYLYQQGMEGNAFPFLSLMRATAITEPFNNTTGTNLDQIGAAGTAAVGSTAAKGIAGDTASMGNAITSGLKGNFKDALNNAGDFGSGTANLAQGGPEAARAIASLKMLQDMQQTDFTMEGAYQYFRQMSPMRLKSFRRYGGQTAYGQSRSAGWQNLMDETESAQVQSTIGELVGATAGNQMAGTAMHSLRQGMDPGKSSNILAGLMAADRSTSQANREFEEIIARGMTKGIQDAQLLETIGQAIAAGTNGPAGRIADTGFATNTMIQAFNPKSMDINDLKNIISGQQSFANTFQSGTGYFHNRAEAMAVQNMRALGIDPTSYTARQLAGADIFKGTPAMLTNKFGYEKANELVEQQRATDISLAFNVGNVPQALRNKINSAKTYQDQAKVMAGLSPSEKEDAKEALAQLFGGSDEDYNKGEGILNSMIALGKAPANLSDTARKALLAKDRGSSYEAGSVGGRLHSQVEAVAKGYEKHEIDVNGKKEMVTNEKLFNEATKAMEHAMSKFNKLSQEDLQHTSEALDIVTKDLYGLDEAIRKVMLTAGVNSKTVSPKQSNPKPAPAPGGLGGGGGSGSSSGGYSGGSTGSGHAGP